MAPWCPARRLAPCRSCRGPTLRVLRNIKNRYRRTAWSRYGFVNAFNPLKNWYDHDVIGIDTGITLLMAENLRSGFVWNTFMKNPEAQRGMKRAGFKKYYARGRLTSSGDSSNILASTVKLFPGSDGGSHRKSNRLHQFCSDRLARYKHFLLASHRFIST